MFSEHSMYPILSLSLSLSMQLLLNVNFSSRTTSMDVQRNLEASVEKRTKDTFGPPPGSPHCPLPIVVHVYKGRPRSQKANF